VSTGVNIQGKLQKNPSPWSFKVGDINGVVYVFAGNLGSFILVAATLLGFGWPQELVFGRVIPGLAFGMFCGSLYYSWMAYRLAKKEGRDDVTALPCGVSTPVLFLYLFGIVAPLQFGLGLPPEEVWKAAIAATVLGGAIEAAGAVAGPFIRRTLPRVAMLGTLAGVGLLWIGTKGLFDVYASPLLGLPILIIAILGLIGGYNLPKNIPPLIVSLVAGIVLALILGESHITFEGVGQLTLPIPVIGSVIQGFRYLGPYLSLIIPIELYNFIETMDNVESASAAGDNYNVAEAQLVDGCATMITGIFGGIVPNTVWIGHPGLKRSGAGIAYSWVSGLLFAVAGFIGIFNFFYNLIPIAIVAIVFLWCALVMLAQAFVDTPRRHAAAVGIALIPHIANYAYTQITSTLQAVGVQLTPEIESALIQQGVLWKGIEALNYGSVLSGMLWASVIAFVIDRSLKKAGIAALVCSVLTFFGVIHAQEFGINSGPYLITIGYLAIALICFLGEAFESKLTVPTRYDYV
jgi:AGZA family xanthine/uracil permease-like MFS transporter